MLTAVMVVGGLILLAMGVWWLGGGRWGWLPLARFQRDVTLPTRLVTGLVHLVLGYHLLAWNVPSGRYEPLRIPREYWPLVVLGGAGVIGASGLVDRLERRSGGGDQAG